MSPSKSVLEHELGRDATHRHLLNLGDHLDVLWAQYLEQLSIYQASQDHLQENFSTAFFSLAKANFAKSSGRRYGRDYYDERAVASLRTHPRRQQLKSVENLAGSSPWEISKADVGIWAAKDERKETLNEKSNVETSMVNEPAQSDPRISSHGADREYVDSDDIASRSRTQQVPTPLPTPEPDTKQSEITGMVKSESIGEVEDTETDVTPGYTDPLSSFAGGLLIPPSLRRAQQCFVTALVSEDSVVGAVNAARALREIEVEINRTRKVIKKLERDVLGS